MARAESIDYAVALNGTLYLKNEVNNLPWEAFFSGIAFLSERFGGHEIDGLLTKYVLSLLEHAYQKLGFTDIPGERMMDKLNRELILHSACKYEYEPCITQAKLLFRLWREDLNKTIPVNAKKAVYCTALKYGDYTDWKFLWNQYLTTNFEAEKVTILQALGCTREPKALDEYLKAALSENTVRDQNINTIYSSVYTADSYGVNVTLEYLISNYDAIRKGYGGWGTVTGLFKSVASRISTQQEMNRLKEFVNAKSTELKHILSELRTAVDGATKNWEWFLKNEATIKTWLKHPRVIVPPQEAKNDKGAGSAIKPLIQLIITSFATIAAVSLFFAS